MNTFKIGSKVKYRYLSNPSGIVVNVDNARKKLLVATYNRERFLKWVCFSSVQLIEL